MEEIQRAFKKLTKLKENLKDLSREEAYTVFKAILEGKLSQVKTSAFLTAMRIKGETPEELLGVVEAIREKMDFPESRENVLDLALNYDGKNRSVYILPSALWLLSKLGLEFTNHYALKVPTKEGITLYELVKALNVNINVQFVDQRDYCPELYKLMPLRRELGFRSFINTVEKFLNPFGAKKVVVSIFHKPYFEKNEKLLGLLDFEDYTIIKGLEGGIEPLPDRPTYVKRKGKEIEEINPKNLKLELPKDVSSQDVLKDSVKVNKRIIDGKEKGEFLNWAIYTAGILLYASGQCENTKTCLERIKEVLE